MATTKQKTETEHSTNEVDASPDRVISEWNDIEADEGLSPEGLEPGPESPGAESEIIQDDQAYRDGAITRCVGVLAGAFSLGFAWFAPGWKVTQEEVGNLALAWGRVLAKWLPMQYLKFIPNLGGEGEASVCIECDALAVTVTFLGSKRGLSPTVQPGANAQGGDQAGDDSADPFASSGESSSPVSAADGT